MTFGRSWKNRSNKWDLWSYIFGTYSTFFKIFSNRSSDEKMFSPGLWIRNDLVRIRLRIRLLKKFRLRTRILFRIRQRWSPPQESCAENSHFNREITTTFISVGDYTNVFVI